MRQKIHLIALTVSLAYSQSQFEVVSIKPTPPGARNSGYRRASPGGLNATNVSLKMLIEYGYDVRDYQVSGGPGWIETERYEVTGKPDAAASVPASPAERMAEVRTRVRGMLADRFQLTLHRTTKELPIFELVAGKNGPKGLSQPKSPQAEMIDNGHHLDCHKISMDALAKTFLQGELGRPVVNKTGLAGEFDFTLDWQPDEAVRRMPVDEPAARAPTAADGPSFFTALQEQLGLKLEPGKGPVELLVIDHAEHASAN